MPSALLVFAACLVFWLLLSGLYGPLEVGLGLASAAAVALWNRDHEVLSGIMRVAPRLGAYLPWLLREIVVANLQVARVVLHPRLPIQPAVCRFTAPFSDDLAMTTLANSITLTPGTITVDIDGRDLVIHSLLGPEAVAACEGPMAQRVARIFRETSA